MGHTWYLQMPLTNGRLSKENNISFFGFRSNNDGDIKIVDERAQEMLVEMKKLLQKIELHQQEVTQREFDDTDLEDLLDDQA